MSCMPFWNATACVCCIDSSKPCSLTKSFITERARSTKGGNVESDVESGRPTVSSFKAASLTLVSIWVYATVYRNHAVPCLSYRLVESDKPHNNKAAQRRNTIWEAAMADGGRALPPAASRICSRSTTRKLPPRRDASASVTLSQSIRTADVVCTVMCSDDYLV